MLQGRLQHPFARVEGIVGGKIFGSDKQIYNGVTHTESDSLLDFVSYITISTVMSICPSVRPCV